MKKFAVGVVVKDRPDLTMTTFTSLYYSSQAKNSYDLFVISNGSSATNTDFLKKEISNNTINAKNLIVIEKELSIPQAWNLFMCITQDYDYRVKVDNDLIFNHTIAPDIPPKPNNAPSPNEYGTNPGAPSHNRPQVGIQRNENKSYDKNLKSSNFLDQMRDFGIEYNVDVVSLVPSTLTVPFSMMHYELTRKKMNGHPFVRGACMMITKKCFDTIGYFNENIQRNIDIEYSQRALLSKLNIGYHPTYFVLHNGALNPTETQNEISKKIEQSSKNVLSSDKLDSMWSASFQEINLLLDKSKIVNLV